MKLHEANQTLQTTLIVTLNPEMDNWKIVADNIKTLKSIPEEIIVICNSLNHAGEISGTIKIKNVLVPIQGYFLNKATYTTNLESIIVNTDAEFVVIEDGSQITPDLIDKYKSKVQKQKFRSASLDNSDHYLRSGAFWKDDFMRVALTRQQLPDNRHSGNH